MAKLSRALAFFDGNSAALKETLRLPRELKSRKWSFLNNLALNRKLQGRSCRAEVNTHAHCERLSPHNSVAECVDCCRRIYPERAGCPHRRRSNQNSSRSSQISGNAK